MNAVCPDDRFFQRHSRERAVNPEFRALKLELIAEFTRRGYSAMIPRESAISFSNRKGICYSLILQNGKVRCEISTWNKQKLEAKSELVYDKIEVVKDLVLLRLLDSDMQSCLNKDKPQTITNGLRK